MNKSDELPNRKWCISKLALVLAIHNCFEVPVKTSAAATLG